MLFVLQKHLFNSLFQVLIFVRSRFLKAQESSSHKQLLLGLALLCCLQLKVSLLREWHSSVYSVFLHFFETLAKPFLILSDKAKFVRRDTVVWVVTLKALPILELVGFKEFNTLQNCNFPSAKVVTDSQAYTSGTVLVLSSKEKTRQALLLSFKGVKEGNRLRPITHLS